MSIIVHLIHLRDKDSHQMAIGKSLFSIQVLNQKFKTIVFSIHTLNPLRIASLKSLLSSVLLWKPFHEQYTQRKIHLQSQNICRKCLSEKIQKRKLNMLHLFEDWLLLKVTKLKNHSSKTHLISLYLLNLSVMILIMDTICLEENKCKILCRQ